MKMINLMLFTMLLSFTSQAFARNDTAFTNYKAEEGQKPCCTPEVDTDPRCADNLMKDCALRRDEMTKGFFHDPSHPVEQPKATRDQ